MENIETTAISVRWEADIPPDPPQFESFLELLQILMDYINPGNSLKEVRIIADNVLVSEIQSLTGQAYQPGPHIPEGVAVPIEQENDFYSVIFIRRQIFSPCETMLLVWLSVLLEEIYHCRLNHQKWLRRGYIHRRTTDQYTQDLFAMCEQMHDEYAVSRLKNMYFGDHQIVFDAQGVNIPYYFEYGSSLIATFDEASCQLHTRDLLQIPLSLRKNALLPLAFRFIFEPLARHAGFLAPVPPSYPLQAPGNVLEGNAFYREVIASYWIPIKSALEASFASQFSKTEEALVTITETMNACLDRLLEIRTSNEQI